jgi:uncharacterized membrane protein
LHPSEIDSLKNIFRRPQLPRLRVREEKVVVQRPLHSLHAVLLAGTVPLFLGVLLSDIAYSLSYEIQWKNFASWLLVGGLVFGGFALLWTLIELLRVVSRGPRKALYASLLLVIWVLGFIDALVHAGDAWASMPAGLILSAVVALLAVTATGLGFSNSHSGAAE